MKVNAIAKIGRIARIAKIAKIAEIAKIGNGGRGMSNVEKQTTGTRWLGRVEYMGGGVYANTRPSTPGSSHCRDCELGADNPTGARAATCGNTNSEQQPTSAVNYRATSIAQAKSGACGEAGSGLQTQSCSPEAHT
jgi:hypothetical protein